MNHFDDDDESPRRKADGIVLKEFECPGCNAHNPCDEKVDRRGIELRCNYCGIEYKVTHDETTSRFKFKEI